LWHQITKSILPRAGPLIEYISGHPGDALALEALLICSPRVVLHLVAGDPLPGLVDLAIGYVHREDRHHRNIGSIQHLGEVAAKRW